MHPEQAIQGDIGLGDNIDRMQLCWEADTVTDLVHLQIEKCA